MRCFPGGTSRLLKAIGSHASLRRACNVLTLPLTVPKHSRSKILSFRPEQRRSLPLRSGGTTATNQPFHDSIYQTLPHPFPAFPYPFFLSFPSIFPLVEISFSI